MLNILLHYHRDHSKKTLNILCWDMWFYDTDLGFTNNFHLQLHLVYDIIYIYIYICMSVKENIIIQIKIKTWFLFWDCNLHVIFHDCECGPYNNPWTTITITTPAPKNSERARRADKHHHFCAIPFHPQSYYRSFACVLKIRTLIFP